MKKINIVVTYLFVLGIVISCKSKITDIKMTLERNNENYKSYMINYGALPDFDFIKRDCPWIKDPANTIFIYMPISFKLHNNTDQDLRIGVISDNFNIDNYQPMIINNKFYKYIDGRVLIKSSDKVNITTFVHIPVPISSLDKVHYDRYFQSPNNRKKDSIVMDKINPELQKYIDSALRKKNISVHLYKDKDFYGGTVTIYCVKNEESATFRMDSIAKLQDGFKYNCD